MSIVKLNQEQQKLRESIEENLNWLREETMKHSGEDEERRKRFIKMGEDSHALHMSLEPKPKHHRYMIENRGMKADEREFYMHIHPVEDLLAYLDDDHANDDPQDKTINQEFKLKVYSRRWGHYDTYTIKRIVDGWEIKFMSRGGMSDKKGKSGLYDILDSDCINYPEALGEYLEYLWDQAKEFGLSYDDIQDNLDKLGAWISSCEINSPTGVFEGYK